MRGAGKVMMRSRGVIGAVLLAAAAATTAGAAQNEGVRVKGKSWFCTSGVGQQLERQAIVQYSRMISAAQSKRAVLPQDHPQVRRLHAIAQRIIPFVKDPKWRARTEGWSWEINLINSPQLNAFCMPGGKIAFFAGIIDKLQLNDDEIAMVMGHEMAHALREHACGRYGKSRALSVTAGVLTQLLGLGDLGQAGTEAAVQLLTLRFSRKDETEADLVGLELAARAGFDPRAGISLWQKMSLANRAAPPQWLSTHPSGQSRIAEIRRQLPLVLPIYARAVGKDPKNLHDYVSNVEHLTGTLPQSRRPAQTGKE
ncbi:MAG: M48 family metallopeptidase [Hyphomicrobiaceae bacterium]|nr:MAG: M48 family metallopeptidase [Hyphomicrobiaceae bacterium]